MLRLLPLLAGVVFSLGSAQNPSPAPAPGPASNPAARTQINPALPTLFIAGDSTAARGTGDTQQGWGVPFAAYLDPTTINVVNRARGGRSSRTFITEGAWDQLLAEVKAGDTVLIQFGHNDGGPINDEPPPPLRARGSLPGLGEETREIDNVLTKQHEVVHTFGWYMRKMIADVKAKGASPVVLSLSVRNRWAGGRIERGSGRYSLWAFDVAKTAAVPFIDVTNAADRLEALGEKSSTALYQQDPTHFNAEGADLHAQVVVAGLKGLRPSPIEKMLSDKGQRVATDTFAWLRLPRAANINLPSLVLVGDSTVRNGRGDGAGGQWGWGDYLEPHLDLTTINIVNRAVGGTGARTFITLGHWEATLKLLRPGDVVIIQFGHNDNGARGALRGVGNEVEEQIDEQTKVTEKVGTFGSYLRRYIGDVRAKGATPILCTLVPRNIWQDGRIARGANTHADWARAVAAAEKVPLLDLHERIAQRYDALGAAAVAPLFADERVHTGVAGAELSAQVVADALQALPASPVASYLKR
jgi:lysophospholipase L1-like esterase